MADCMMKEKRMTMLLDQESRTQTSPNDWVNLSADPMSEDGTLDQKLIRACTG